MLELHVEVVDAACARRVSRETLAFRFLGEDYLDVLCFVFVNLWYQGGSDTLSVMPVVISVGGRLL